MAGKIRRLIIIINDDWLDVGSIELFFTDFLLSIKEIRGEELAGKIRRLIIIINDDWRAQLKTLPINRSSRARNTISRTKEVHVPDNKPRRTGWTMSFFKSLRMREKRKRGCAPSVYPIPIPRYLASLCQVRNWGG